LYISVIASFLFSFLSFKIDRN